ncbi:MAG: hypothetical protein GY874_21810 [Desulfobacteraceae bacterium]|nr:hypothetical protein [Desulfobacteraceae bacterium]
MKWLWLRSNWHFISIFLFFVLSNSQIQADQYHYVNILVGHRAAGLGGAYAALADDSSGCFHNPAGIALSASDGISASMNAYVRSIKVYKNTLTGTDGKKMDWEQESSNLLPNYFGVIKRIGNNVAGISYAVPDSIERRQKQSFLNIQSVISGNPIDTLTININDSDRTYLFGPSYALELRPNLTIGGTLYAYFRDKEIIRNQVLQFNQGQHFWINYYETKEDWGLLPKLGIIWEPHEKLALGLTIARTYLFSSDTETQTTFRDSTSPDFADTNALSFISEKNDSEDDFALNTTLGIAYFTTEKLLLSMDISYYGETDDKETVVNVALGTEYYLKDNLAFRCGFYTDFSNTPSLKQGQTNQPEHIDVYGVNLSVSLFHRQSSITLGTAYVFGSGEAQVISGGSAIQDTDIKTFTLFLAASYSL